MILKTVFGKPFAYEKMDEGQMIWTEDLWCAKLYQRKGNAKRIISSIVLDPYEDNDIQYKIVPALQMIDLRYVVKRNMHDNNKPIECRIVWYDKGKVFPDSFGTRYEAEKELKRLKSEISEELYQKIHEINRIHLM